MRFVGIVFFKKRRELIAVLGFQQISQIMQESVGAVYLSLHLVDAFDLIKKIGKPLVPGFDFFIGVQLPDDSGRISGGNKTS